MGKWGRVLAECLCPKACGGQHFPGFGPRFECLTKAHFLSPGTVCHPLVWGWTFYLCENWHIPAVLQHKGCVCISATFPPQHLSGPDSHHTPEQSSAPNQFYSRFHGVWSFKSAEKALQLRVGRCDQDCVQVQHIFLVIVEKEIASMSPSPGGFEHPSGARCSVWGSAQVQTQPSLRDIVAQISGIWHEYCGWKKRKLVHQAMGQDPWAVLPCAAEVPVTSWYLDRPSLGDKGELLGAHSEGRWGIWGSCLMVFSMQEESVQPLLACAPKNSASVQTVFSTWLWKLPPGSWCWTFGEL